MKHALAVAALGFAPLVAGCTLFQTDQTPPRAASASFDSRDASLPTQVRSASDGTREFAPLVEARAAVEAANAQPEVSAYDAQSLAEAEAALEQAETSWAALSDRRRPAIQALVPIAADAHRAQRLAEIARYTAQREIDLEQLIAVNEQLEARQPESDAGEAARPAVPLTDQARGLIGQKIIPDRLGGISFETGTARMRNDSRATVAELAQLLAANPSVGIAIFGHTDNVGPSDESLERFVNANPQLEAQAPSRSDKVRAFNLALSAARARAVAQALVENGVPARRIGARGFGDTRPVASNDSAEGRRANRRIEAVVVPGPDSPEAREIRSGS